MQERLHGLVVGRWSSATTHIRQSRTSLWTRSRPSQSANQPSSNIRERRNADEPKTAPSGGTRPNSSQRRSGMSAPEGARFRYQASFEQAVARNLQESGAAPADGSLQEHRNVIVTGTPPGWAKASAIGIRRVCTVSRPAISTAPSSSRRQEPILPQTDRPNREPMWLSGHLEPCSRSWTGQTVQLPGQAGSRSNAMGSYLRSPDPPLGQDRSPGRVAAQASGCRPIPGVRASLTADPWRSRQTSWCMKCEPSEFAAVRTGAAASEPAIPAPGPFPGSHAPPIGQLRVESASSGPLRAFQGHTLVPP